MASAIARNLVRNALRVKADDAVAVQTAKHMIPLAEEVALECYQVGADVLLLLDSERVTLGYYKLLSLEQLRTPSPHCLGLGRYTTVNIFMSSFYDPRLLRQVPGEKLAALGASEKPHGDLMRERKIRIAGLALASITPPRARAYGLNYQRWRRAVQDASAADSAKIAAFGKRLAALLEGSGHVTVTQGTETRLEFELAGRRPHLYDGVLDDEDLAAGTHSVDIPDGSVAVAPREDSARGSVTFDIDGYQKGKTIRHVHWRFENGRVTEFTAKQNLDAIRPQFDAASGGKDLLGSLTFGINPRARTGLLFNQNPIGYGAVSISIGGNKWIGGTNDSEFGWEGTLSHATVSVDGRTIVDRGRFTL